MGKEIGFEEFKQISLDILDAVHHFCEEHNIKYSLACGTLIGAIRHKGFIPWDDDIDIYMPRQEYNNFMTLFPDLCEGKYALVAFERNTPGWNYPYAKVYDSRTRYIEDKKYDFYDMGIGIDVFPIDSAPNDEKEWTIYESKRKALRNIYVMKELRWRKGRSLLKNILVQICSLLLYPFSKRKLAMILDKYAQKYNASKTEYCAENCLGKPNARFLYTDFSTIIDSPFENRVFKIMAGYDDYLRSFYGNYMQMPPPEEQVSHHRFTAYWK